MVHLDIQGMTCGHCVGSVKRALESVAGVEKGVEVDLGRGEATVHGQVDPAVLVKAVEEEGYQAQVRL